MKTALEALVNEMVERGIYFEDAVNEFEKKFIQTVLEKHRGNVSRTAEELHIHRNTVSKKLESYNNKGQVIFKKNGAKPKRKR